MKMAIDGECFIEERGESNRKECSEGEGRCTLRSIIPSSPMSLSARLQDAALVLLRLIVAAIFLNAGYGKLFFWSAPPEGTPAGMVYLMQFLSIVEPLGAVALIAGFLTRWAALGLAITMVGAAVFVRIAMHSAFFTSATGTGIDYITLIFASCVALIAFGGGKWTVDTAWKKK